MYIQFKQSLARISRPLTDDDADDDDDHECLLTSFESLHCIYICAFECIRFCGGVVYIHMYVCVYIAVADCRCFT